MKKRKQKQNPKYQQPHLVELPIIKNNKIQNLNNIFPFNKMIQEYILEITILNYSKNTILTYRSILKGFHKYLKKQKDLYDPHTFRQAYKKYILYKKEKGVSTNYTYLITVVIKNFCNYHKLDWMKEIPSPKRTKSLPKALTMKEVEQLIKATAYKRTYPKRIKQKRLRDQLILTLLYSSGLRINECLTLTIHQININERTIRVRGKGDKDRVVIFDVNTQKLLKKYLKTQTIESDYLFPTRTGEHLQARYIECEIKEYAKKAGLTKNITPHMLRHSFATHLLNNGVNIRVIQQLLGHSSLATTQIYTFVDMETIRKTYDTARKQELI